MRTAPLHDLPKLYRSGAVRAAEQVAMVRFGLDQDDLMARAGLAAWRLLLDRWPQAQRCPQPQPAPFLPRLPSPSRGALWRPRVWKQGTMPPL